MSNEVLKILRQVRFGLDENDTSRDGELMLLSPKRALELVCQWELGDGAWANTFHRWSRGCGFEITC